MSENSAKITTELQEISEEAKQKFGVLSGEQINWKQSVEQWSVGQCFEHLIKSSELFYGELDKIAAGTRQNSLLENYSPLSGFFGKLLTNSLRKDGRKFKAPTKKIVPPSEIDPNIVEVFAVHQVELIEKINSVANVDWQKTVVTSPFMKFITYRLSEGFNIIVEHERRHLRQAERVTKMNDFPKVDTIKTEN